MATGKAHDLLENYACGKSPRPLIIAHRGFAGRFPENTLTAFRAGLATGADVVELDYHHSADGVPIVIHDSTLSRTTDAAQFWGTDRLEVAARTAGELARLNPTANSVHRLPHERLATLAQVLDLIQASSITMIERKVGDAATLVRLLREQKCESDVVVQAFDWDFLRDCRALSKELVLGALGNDELTRARVQEAVEIGVEIITWKQEILDRRGIELIHDAGKQAWSYTINEVARAKELVNAGLDGVISNFPDEMMELRRA